MLWVSLHYLSARDARSQVPSPHSAGEARQKEGQLADNFQAVYDACASQCCQSPAQATASHVHASGSASHTRLWLCLPHSRLWLCLPRPPFPPPPPGRYTRTLAELEEQTEMVILLGVATSGPARWCTLWSLWPLSVLGVIYSATQRAPVAGSGCFPTCYISVG